MHAMNFTERKLTELDAGRLRQLSGRAGPEQLSDLLDEAEILEARDAPGDLVTMYAQVAVEDTRTRRRHDFVLCYPGQSEPRDGHISVLSPVGLALIGLRTGATATWHSPAGERCEATVLSVAPAVQLAA